MASLFDQHKLLVRCLKLVEVCFRRGCWRDRIGIALEDEERDLEAHSELAEIGRQKFVKQLIGREVHALENVHEIAERVVGRSQHGREHNIHDHVRNRRVRLDRPLVQLGKFSGSQVVFSGSEFLNRFHALGVA